MQGRSCSPVQHKLREEKWRRVIKRKRVEKSSWRERGRERLHSLGEERSREGEEKGRNEGHGWRAEESGMHLAEGIS